MDGIRNREAICPVSRTVIIGAGIGGLAAAVALASSGEEVTVLERAATPGGKMRRLAVNGQPIDGGPTVLTMRAVFEEFKAHEQRRPATLAVWVGPEGDFTPQEIAALVNGGVQPITLGRLVLRCDTAAVATLALALNEAAGSWSAVL